jgi:hypothetical protein
MPGTLKKMLLKASPWILGILLSTAGMFLGYNFGSDTARLPGGEPGIWARLAKGSVWGLIIAGLQWPVVRSAGTPPARFLLVSALGFGFGYPLGQTFQAVLLTWGLAWTGYGAALVAFGLSLGLPQWWILRRHVHRAGFWIGFSVTAWILTGVGWISFGGASGLDSVLYGVAAGPALVWLVRSRPPGST